MTIVKCPGCGKPLTKKPTSSRYYCETESCPIIFVQRPHHFAIRKIAFKPSANLKIVRKIEQTPVQIM